MDTPDKTGEETIQRLIKLTEEYQHKVASINDSRLYTREQLELRVGYGFLLGALSGVGLWAIVAAVSNVT